MTTLAKQTNSIKTISYFFCLVVLIQCKQKNDPAAVQAAVESRTPVTVTSISYQPLEDYITVNATSTYLQKDIVKSNLNGYIEKAFVKFGDFVNRGQILFLLKTKEAAAIGNTVNQLDPNFKFSGTNPVRADASGYLAEVNHQRGDYVQDGEQLAIINDAGSFVFVMNVPYDYSKFVSRGKQVQLTLPDGERLIATVQSSLPLMDSISQTQAIALKVAQPHSIPLNLVATVKIVKSAVTSAPTFDKRALLSDETQTEYWVMKMINDSTAVKVPVKTGMESGQRVQIISPTFEVKDQVLLTGNYGLPDTALVTVQK
jgi:multidrug efflux pump subunit AcrA (membrane-fusion protein)